MTQEKGLAVREQNLGITQASLTATAEQLKLLEQLVEKVLRKDEDYGIIPGTNKPTLLKPGAANVTSAFNCHAEPHIEQETIDLDKGYIFYRARVDILSNLNGALRASGYGSCSSYEVKYRYRDQKRKCPECNKETIIKGRQEYGGGWLCFAKLGGCGAKFKEGDEEIESQVVGKVIVEDPMEQANTLLKMAVKRAEVDASMRLPGVARFFTQDIGDDKEPEPPVEKKARSGPPPAQTPPPAPSAQPDGKESQAVASTASAGRPEKVWTRDIIKTRGDYSNWFISIQPGRKPEEGIVRLAGYKSWMEVTDYGEAFDRTVAALEVLAERAKAATAEEKQP